MPEQLIINQEISVVSSKKHAATIIEHRLSDPSLMILEFGWKMAKAHYHLYQKQDEEWDHIFKANQIDKVIQKAQGI